ncbi:receptor-type tyrosine-protein phosphatase C isoform X2 [Chelmon rostratus]|uniref:receptor-type tyrosine-protein phosphatase C isoform X2 n=1 Tax=Chelmon rostratus TaxID=109905 RepID=UPI001BE67FB8|nr:receptor-type tyrosine-protein phosphatase C isoform X2 [Chelmon rostratus]
MAGLCGLKILLLWAGIITLANCNNETVTTTPANTPRSPTSTSKETDSQSHSTQTQTSPPITMSTITVTTATKATQVPLPLECSYTVKVDKSMVEIAITRSTAADCTIDIKEEGKPWTVRKFSSSGNSSLKIDHLKPCTYYEHNVTCDAFNKKASCSHNGSTIRTAEMSKHDIENVDRDHEYVCYRSEWDISSSISTIPVKTRANKTFCIKPSYDDICSNLTTTFTSENCRNSSFSLTKSIGVEFLKPGEIDLTFSDKLPTEIVAHLPSKCVNPTTHYTCTGEHGEHKNLSELEPYTDYTCKGHIEYNNTVIPDTKNVFVRVDCDLKITNTNTSPSDTSMVLSWDTTSQKCQKLEELKNLSYECECHLVPPHSKCRARHNVKGQIKERRCEVSGLAPHTYYTCKVHPTYNNKTVKQSYEFDKQETKSGVPEATEEVTLTLPEHNVISVTCADVKCFNGPHPKYIARIYDGNILKGEKETASGNKCSFEFRDLSYSTTYRVEVTASNGIFKSKPIVKETSTRYNDRALIGFLVFLIILTSVALLFVVYKIYILKRRKSNDLNENMMLISTANDEENLLPVEPISSEALLEAYKRKLADEGRLFLAEFQSIPRIFSRYNVKEAKKPCNVPKNRYVDILPYDYNRVELTSGNGEAGCDYINASFIDGYKESKKYIAAQGPKDETVSDFWRMVWEQQSSIIVMVTRCEEGNRLKCAQYWPSPDRETEIFAEFIVRLSSENHCPDYTIRHLSLINKREKNSEREVTHIQFMSWPDHGVPGDPHLLLKLRRRVNAFKNFFSGPIVVHCSAGVGRTGTYIGIDAMMEGLEAEGRVDIYGYVVRLRRQRCLMVQVEAQYILIHQALLEHNQFGETEITLPELHSTLSTLRQRNSSSELTLLEDEFDRLPTYKNWRTFNTGLTDDNKKKNRSSSVIPYDYNRVLLKLDEGHSRESDHDEDEEDDSSDEEDEESTKYINASHIDGYWGPHTFITAQTPLPDTMADFWCMVYQKKASTIVMLSDCSEGDKADCVYWDKDQKTFEDFEVEVVSTDTSPTFITRNMLLRHVKRKDGRPVKHFQFLKWASGEVPEKPQDLTDMIKDIKHSCGSRKSQRGTPIVVHCNDGSTRSGIFCALWNLLDCAETEKLVDAFQVAKTLRKERQGMLSSLEQYQFLYKALEMFFPVQNGEVKASAAVQIVNETKAAEQPAEERAEEPASTTSIGQQGAEGAPTVADGEKEEKKEKPEKVSGTPTETTPLEDTSNGPGVTVEV